VKIFQRIYLTLISLRLDFSGTENTLERKEIKIRYAI